MSKTIYYKTDDLIAVDSPKIGEKYHLSWAKSKGMVWKLLSINGEDITMITPKTGKILRAKRKDLRHLRKNQYKIEEQLKREKRNESNTRNEAGI
jgi:hypothetical protein